MVTVQLKIAMLLLMPGGFGGVLTTKQPLSKFSIGNKLPHRQQSQSHL